MLAENHALDIFRCRGQNVPRSLQTYLLNVKDGKFALGIDFLPFWMPVLFASEELRDFIDCSKKRICWDKTLQNEISPVLNLGVQIFLRQSNSLSRINIFDLVRGKGLSGSCSQIQSCSAKSFACSIYANAETVTDSYLQ